MLMSNIMAYSLKTNEFNPYSISTTTTEIIQINGCVNYKDLDLLKEEKNKNKITTKQIKIKKSK